MKQYLTTLKYILENGVLSDSKRNKTRTIAVVDGTQTKYNLQEGFPAITTRKLAWKSVVGEFLWIMQGKTNIKELSMLTYGVPDKKTIWTPNYESQGLEKGYSDGELGCIYGWQLRTFEGVTYKDTKGVSVDQLKYVINALKSDPSTRKAHLSYWNPCQLEEMTLEPCHVSATFNLQNNKLYCSMLMRSNDAFHGEVYNVAFYSLMTHCLSIILGAEVGVYTHNVVNHHIYEEHIDAVKEQLTREPFPLPTLKISDRAIKLLQDKGIDAFDELIVDDFILENYKHHEPIKKDMVV